VVTIAFGTMAVKQALADGSDPREVMVTGQLLAGALAAVFLPRALMGLPRRLLLMALVASAGLAVTNAAAFEALDRLPAGIVVVLVFCSPIWVAIGQPLFLRSPIGRREGVGAVLVLIGILTMVGSVDPSLDLTGVALGVASSIGFAVFLLGTKPLDGVGSGAGSAALVLPFTGLISLALWPAAGVNGVSELPGTPYVLFVGVAVCVWAVLLAAGLRRTTPMTTVVVSALEPALVTIMSYLFFSEGLRARELVGGSLVLLGALLAMLQDARGAYPERAPAPREASSAL
jgi:drug/metabolite transporter (DMT)-like permease